MGRRGTEHQRRSLFSISAEKAVPSVSAGLSYLKTLLELLWNKFITFIPLIQTISMRVHAPHREKHCTVWSIFQAVFPELKLSIVGTAISLKLGQLVKTAKQPHISIAGYGSCYSHICIFFFFWTAALIHIYKRSAMQLINGGDWFHWRSLCKNNDKR